MCFIIFLQSISPGLVDTPMADDKSNVVPKLKPSDVVDAIVYVLAAPQSVNVSLHKVTITPVYC